MLIEIVLSSFLSIVSAVADPWKTLGISRSASTKEIKTAYKKLAKEWHPDINKSPEAEDRFVDIAEAYQILTDDEKRREWESSQNSGFGHSFRRSTQGSRWGGGFSPDDLFDQFFGQSNFGEDGVSTRDFFNNILQKTNRSPHIFLFTSPWCFECRRAKQVFSQVEPELRKWGFGTGKVNANVYAKLNDFMNVHKVPSIVVVYNENPYPVPLADLYRGSQPLKEFCENLASSSVIIEELSTEEKAESFMNQYPKTMRPRIWLITEKDSVAGMFSSIASQFRGEIDFAFSKFNADAINMIRVSLKISEPSLVFFKEQNTPAEIIPINKLKYHGGIMEKIKKYRTLELTRIAHPEQFFSRCQVHTSGDSPPLCLIFVHHGSFDDPVAQNFVKWTAQHAKEMKSEAVVNIMSGNNQYHFSKMMGTNGKSTAVIVQRLKTGLRFLQIPHNQEFDGFTAAAWKGIFSKENYSFASFVNIVDEDQDQTFFGSSYRYIWKSWRRLRHFEEEELLIYICAPLAVIMLTAAFFMSANAETNPKRPRVTKRERQTAADLPLRPLKKLEKDEISNFLTERVKFFVVLVISDTTVSEAERDIMMEMTRQFAIKIQEFKCDPHIPDFFCIKKSNIGENLASNLDVIPGTVLALGANWWAGYQIDQEDDIYMDNILPNVEHWLARLQEGAIKRQRYK
ncbi:unnamed protein product [Oikopleura dioica]|uniref:J domain-containing protein n=1 Tax=Oikopleura dioica TaxID=34765 RepID=E4WS71_OIKDI|nr:unnamed protein product [Oikopleura dioica]